MQAIRCELCGSNELVKSGGMFVCQYCGTKYTTEEARKLVVEATVTLQGSVQVNGIPTVNNTITRAREFESAGDFDSAETYYNRVLDADPTNAEARAGLARIERYVYGPNLTVDFSKGNSGSVVTLFVDGKRVAQIWGGNIQSFTIPYGEHTVGVAGGLMKCKHPVRIMIKRNARFLMVTKFKGLSAVFQVYRQ